jgi:hypothetical protein
MLGERMLRGRLASFQDIWYQASVVLQCPITDPLYTLPRALLGVPGQPPPLQHKS